MELIKRQKTVRDYVVYVHRSPSGKCYVGITKHYARRCLAHQHESNRCRLFARVVKKYGWENIEHIILESGLTLKEAKEKEQYYIEYYNSFAPHGYNLTTGGEGYTVSDETRQKQSNSLKGHKHTDETRQIMTQSNKNKGSKRSEEFKKMISQINKGRNPSREQKVKASESNKGKKRTEEQKQNHKAAWIKRVELYGLRGVKQ
jgi:group I intron endonuclease